MSLTSFTSVFFETISYQGCINESGMMSKLKTSNSYLNKAFELPGKLTLRIAIYRMNCREPTIPNSKFKAYITSMLTKNEPSIAPKVIPDEASVVA